MTAPEPSQANRITHFDRPKPRPGRPVEGTVYVKPPAGPKVWWSPSFRLGGGLIWEHPHHGGVHDVRDVPMGKGIELPADAVRLIPDTAASESERAEGWRDQVRLLLAAIHHGYGYSPGCGNDSCPCARPSIICESWEGDPLPASGWCVRCGWERDAHPDASIDASGAVPGS